MAAYPDRIAMRREDSRTRYRLTNGAGLALHEVDPLGGSAFLVVPELDAGGANARAFRAAPLHESDIRAGAGARIQTVQRIEWDPQEESVASVMEERLGELVLTRAPAREANPDQIGAAMLRGVRAMGLGCLPWTRASATLRARIASMRRWRANEPWPDTSDERLVEDLESWLAPYLSGMTRRSHLERLDLVAIVRAMLPTGAYARLEEGAPSHLQVPSGSRVRLEYRPDSAPVLAVKLQEMFGLSDTPTVCWGEVPVMLHLLSPAGRPVQVTQDLAGFWAGTYDEVRRELRGRYPKHPWPESPLQAPPTRRTKRS